MGCNSGCERMRLYPMEETLEIIKKLDPQIIGFKLYDKYEQEITTDKIVCLATKNDISVTNANANMILKSILSKDLLTKIPTYTKKVNHPVFAAPKTIKQLTTWKTKKTRKIEELLEGFPFADEITKSRAIALMITPFIYFKGVKPIGIYLGNRERIGKDYLASLTRILANDDCGELPPLKNEEETRKSLLALAISNDEFAHFSNNIGHMNSPSLEQAVTSLVLKGRILGKTEMIHVPFNLVVSLSGNAGWSLTPDLTYRSVIVTLHSDEEDILQREFKTSPSLLAEQYREEFWNTIKEMYDLWVEKGKPRGKINHATFPEWSKIICGIMETNGYINPLKPSTAGTIQSLIDRDGEEWKIFLPLLSKVNESLSIKDMIEIAETNEYFEYFDFKKHGYRTAFGKLVKKYCDRWFGDYRIIKEGTNMKGTNTGKQKYVVEIKNIKVEENKEKVINGVEW
jgi:hypothetical protein